MKALEILHNYPSKTRMYSIYPRSECDEAIEEIEDLQDKLTKAQSYIIELEDKLRGYIRENGY